MKKITVFILVLFMLSMVTPASAAHEVGEYMNLMDTTPGLVYPANTPFFDAHGWWMVTHGTQALGVSDFRMEINGSSAGPGERYFFNTPDCADLCMGTMYTFPNGLPAGTYTFTGYWYAPCQYGDNPSECSTPNQPVILLTVTTTITFQ